MNEGFTLVEVIIVIFILGTLGMVGLGALGGGDWQEREAQRLENWANTYEMCMDERASMPLYVRTNLCDEMADARWGDEDY